MSVVRAGNLNVVAISVDNASVDRKFYLTRICTNLVCLCVSFVHSIHSRLVSINISRSYTASINL